MSWAKVIENFGKDAVATVVYLYFDELASLLDSGKRASDFEIPSMILWLLAEEDGWIDQNMLDDAIRRAWERFRQEWGGLLPEPDPDDVEDVIWYLGG
jgi:hypothetical protein